MERMIVGRSPLVCSWGFGVLVLLACEPEDSTRAHGPEAPLRTVGAPADHNDPQHPCPERPEHAGSDAVMPEALSGEVDSEEEAVAPGPDEAGGSAA